MLRSHHLHFGNLRLYDIRPVVNLHHFKPDFNRLTIDPYVPEGFRRKHILRVTKAYGKYMKIANKPLFQSVHYNPTHGDIHRVYKEFDTINIDALTKVLDLFYEVAEVKDEEEVMFQAQRITCSPNKEGLPSVEGWHRDGVDKIGIICVDRYNIEGGVSEFMNLDRKKFSVELPRGHMCVFEDANLLHRVTPIRSGDGFTDGMRDVILLSK